MSLLVHALRLISIRPRSCGELKTRLTQICERRRRSLRPAVRAVYESIDCASEVAAAIQELVDDGRLDDEAYASWHGSQRALNRPRSRIKLMAELRQRGVGSELTIAECAKVDETAAATAVAQRKQSLGDEALLRLLLRQGFPLRAARAAVQQRRRDLALDDEGGVDEEGGAPLV